MFPIVGSPDPMSMNCLTPCWAIHLAARWWNPRFDQAQSLISGAAYDPLGRFLVNLEMAVATKM